MTVNRMSKNSLATPAKYRNLRAGNVEVTGGILSEDATYFYRTFTSSGTLGIVGGSLQADVLVVAGGGGGASAGAGAGGFLSLSSYTINIGASTSVMIGAGGSRGSWPGSGTSGSNSSFSTTTAIGGGYGGPPNVNGGNGGSGGGGGSTSGGGVPVGGLGTAGQGYGGGAGTNASNQYGGGGGGGAGAVGGNYPAGVGGTGLQWLNGFYYAGGGGSGYSASAGGAGGGGTGGSGTAGSATDGGFSTGGGGGGSIFGAPGNGGSGVVIVRYPKSSITSTFADYELIGTITVSSNTSTITFSGIPQQYKDIQLKVVARTSSAATEEDMVLKFNGDATAANYWYHGLYGTGSASGSENTNSISGARIAQATSANNVAGSFGVGTFHIVDYSKTTKNKVINSYNGHADSTTRIWKSSNLWLSATAVTSVTITGSSGGSFVAGSRFSLYGIRG